MKLPKSDILFRIRYAIGFLPFLSRFVFLNDSEIISELKKHGAIEYISKLRSAERGKLYFTVGKDIRNGFLLWHPKNPYTLKKLSGLTDLEIQISPYHPDNFSWSIISRLITESGRPRGISDVDFSEYLLYSLLARTTDDIPTLLEIKSAVEELAANGRWEIINETLAEALAYDISDAKLDALLAGVGDNASRIRATHYLLIAQRLVGK